MPGPATSYAPFHFYNSSHWGIYIRDFGLLHVASKFLGRQSLTAADNWVLELARQFLLAHEYFHFQTEVAVSRYEILLFQSTMYQDHVYLHHCADRHSSWLEELVANAKAFREIQRLPNSNLNFTSFLASWMKSQPPGYRDYTLWNTRNGLKKGEAEITAHLHASVRHWRHGPIESDSSALHLYRNAEYSTVPIFRVPDRRLSLGSVRHFPKAFGLRVSVFSNDHPPPHIHVDFLDGNPTVRIGWPSLQPLGNGFSLSRSQRENLRHYLSLHRSKILERLKKVFGDPALSVVG